MKFSDVLGQDFAKERLRRMIDEDKIPHAILLSGAQSIPKLALAQAAAQYIHCTNHINGDSCGVCPSCVQHQTFNHADTFFSFPVIKKNAARSPVSNDYIEEWRGFLKQNSVENYEKWLSLLQNDNAQPLIYVTESDSIIHKMSMTTYSSKYKVMIMWLPEKMNEDCANKLLKIIEEPYPDSIFIFVSDNPKLILPTIYSRTQQIELKKLSCDTVAQYLVEKYGVDRNDALAIASSTDCNAVLAEEALSTDSENKAFFKEFTSLMRLGYSRDIKSLKTWSEGVAAYKREKTRRFLVYASRMIRENFIYNIKDGRLNYLSNEESAFSSRFAPFINEGNVMQMMEVFDTAESDIKGNANGKIVLFDLAIKITILIKR